MKIYEYLDPKTQTVVTDQRKTFPGAGARSAPLETVPSSGARSAPAPGNRSELRRAKRAGAQNVFLGSGAPRVPAPGTVTGALILIVAREKFNNAKGQLGSAHQSDNSFTEIQ